MKACNCALIASSTALTCSFLWSMLNLFLPSGQSVHQILHLFNPQRQQTQQQSHIHHVRSMQKYYKHTFLRLFTNDANMKQSWKQSVDTCERQCFLLCSSVFSSVQGQFLFPLCHLQCQFVHASTQQKAKQQQASCTAACLPPLAAITVHKCVLVANILVIAS